MGHEPQVSELLAQLIGSSQPDRMTFKKGGVAVVDRPAGPEGVAVLLAVLPRASCAAPGLTGRSLS